MHAKNCNFKNKLTGVLHVLKNAAESLGSGEEMVLEYWQSSRLTKLHTYFVLLLCEPCALCKQTNLEHRR